MHWEKMLLPYKQAADELKVKFDNISLQMKKLDKISPIFSVEARIKTIPSILAKAKRKQIPLSFISQKIEDIAGIRIICRFVDDITEIVSIIEARDDIQIIDKRDYVSEMKTSGYRSYHLIASYDVITAYGSQSIKCEIQIRTLAMNFWAVTEHSLRYKYRGKIPNEIHRRLIRAADGAFLLDSDINIIKYDILEAEKDAKTNEEIIMDITNNIEELYNVAESEAVEELYKRFIAIFDTQDENKLQKFYEEIILIAKEYKIR